VRWGLKPPLKHGPMVFFMYNERGGERKQTYHIRYPGSTFATGQQCEKAVSHGGDKEMWAWTYDMKSDKKEREKDKEKVFRERREDRSVVNRKEGLVEQLVLKLTSVARHWLIIKFLEES